MDQHSPQRFNILPPVVKNLLIINAIMLFGTFALLNSFGFDLTQKLAFHYPTSEYFKPYQFITYMFMHGNLSHVFFNMFAVWMFGSAMENYWGSKKFLIYYMITGIGAAIVHTGYLYYEFSAIHASIEQFSIKPTAAGYISLIQEHFKEYANDPKVHAFYESWKNFPASSNQFIGEAMNDFQTLIQFKSNIPTVGASGAVFGLLLAYGMTFPNSLIFIYFLFPLKAKYFVILYGLLELVSGLMERPDDNVAHFAHLGGMLFGFILIMAWKKRKPDNTFYKYYE